MSETKVDPFLRFRENPKADPLQKYAPLYQGINLGLLATIEEADLFLPILQEELKKEKSVIFEFKPELRAYYNSGTFAVQGVPRKQLEEDGFPVNVPIYLHYVLRLDGSKPEDVEIEKNAPSFNVAAAIRQYAQGYITGVALEVVQSVMQYREQRAASGAE